MQDTSPGFRGGAEHTPMTRVHGASCIRSHFLSLPSHLSAGALEASSAYDSLKTVGDQELAQVVS